MDDLIYKLESAHEEVKIPENLIFGRTFTTHVFEMDYQADEGGWKNPTIKKFSDVNLSPAALVFHYGQAIFEGLKAYKQENGDIVMFRPEKNLERFNNSARKMCIPEIDVDFVLQALKELVKIEKGLDTK